MAKTLKQFLEVYKPKSADEQRFVDKHVTVKIKDRNGNEDDVFQATNVKTIDRKKERKGYNPGEDEKVYEELKGNQHKIDANKNGKVDAHDFKLLRSKKKVAEEAGYLEKDLKKRKVNNDKAIKDMKKMGPPMRNPHFGEEVEQIDELSPATLGSYIKKAKTQMSRSDTVAGRLAGERMKGGKPSAQERKHSERANKRYFGIDKAVDRLAKEEVEQVDEKINLKKASMGTVVKDFQKSDAPQFKGKSQEKRRVMAIAAKLTAERGGKPLRKEERLAQILTDLSESHKNTMLSVFNKLNEDNQKKFLQACETEGGIERMLDFSISHRGE